MTGFPTFAQFHTSTQAREPYAWQTRLAEGLANGELPALIDVPTGLGKSSVLLAAVWALARQVHHGGSRSMPQRIIHVIDRRRVVDQAHLPLADLRDMLASPDGALRPVSQALRSLSGPWGEPLSTQRIHGEVGDSRDWLRPTGCCVVGMTPHQFVSRLLFRGFGVGPRTRSLHAGLLGVDALIVFDEPHLSAQAISTTAAALAWQARAAQDLGVPRSHLMLLGATVPEHVLHEAASAVPAPPGGFRLSGAERRGPDITPRLTKSKPLRLVPTAAKNVEGRLVALAKAAHQQGVARVGVMVNTVATAQAVFAALRAADPAWQLITSRMRATDRAGLDPATATRVVSTQCLEVGVDISFDTLIIESCPYPVLTQRLGRLDRDLNCPTPEAAVVMAGDQQGGDVVRPGTAAVYGEDSITQTQRYLRSIADADGVVAMDLAAQLARRDEVPKDCWPRSARLATFHPGYADTMTTTWPTPTSDLPVAAFIAGPEEQERLDVLVAWREDLDAVRDGCDPLPAEMVAVPLAALRALLVAEGAAEVVADIPAATQVKQSGGAVRPRLALTRTDRRWTQVDHTRQLLPGQTVVVLASHLGGYTPELGFAPEQRERVPDHALVAAAMARAHASYRQTHSVPLSSRTLAAYLNATALDTELDRWLAELPHRLAGYELTPAELAEELVERRLPPEWEIQLSSSNTLVVSWPNEPELRIRRATAGQGLADHLAHVTEVARRGCEAAGLSGAARMAIEAAARGHDEGKIHDSFQRYLGNLDGGPPVAKSHRGVVNAAADRRHARRVGHPIEWRHEGLSVSTSRARGEGPLVEHLIGSHHGRYRPLLGSAVATEPGQEDVPDRARDFQRLNEAWGPWGLAYLEAAVRLSDWHASANPPKNGTAPVATAVRAAGRAATPAPGWGAGRWLTGLVSSPMTGWYAAAGLLFAVRDLAQARLSWSEEPADLGAPRWHSRMPLEEAVGAALTSPQWSHLEKAGSLLADRKGYGVKYQKIGPADAVRRVLRSTHPLDAPLISGLTQDAGRAEAKGQLALTIPAFANNSSYPERALSVIAAARRNPERTVETTTAALLDPLQGWATEKCDGGMDRPAADGGIRGVEPEGGRQVRQALAPLALLGMAAFGAGGSRGPSVIDGERCHLPCPAQPTDLATLGALLRGGPGATTGRQCRWQNYTRTRIEKESVWTPRP